MHPNVCRRLKRLTDLLLRHRVEKACAVFVDARRGVLERLVPNTGVEALKDPSLPLDTLQDKIASYVGGMAHIIMHLSCSGRHEKLISLPVLPCNPCAVMIISTGGSWGYVHVPGWRSWNGSWQHPCLHPLSMTTCFTRFVTDHHADHHSPTLHNTHKH